MKRKVLSALLIGAMTAAVLVGCGSSKAGSGSTTAAGSSQAEKTETSAAAGTSAEASSDTGTEAAGSESAWKPEKTINWMVTSSAGGGSDLFTRTIGDIMTKENLVNGQTIVVTNKTDGAGEIGRNEVATTKNNADYQLLTFNSGDLMPMVTNTKNRASNFRILAVMAVDKQLLLSDSATPYKDFAEAIEKAKSGTVVHVGGSKGDDIATFKKLLEEIGVTEDQMTYTTYNSTGDAITAALGGHVDYVMAKPAACTEYVTSGDLKPVLALSTERFGGNLADAPKLSEIGDYKDVEVPVWRGVAAPQAMSDEAAQYWSDTLKAVSETGDWKENYISKNMLIADFMDTKTATDYVTKFESDYLATLSK
ncbi:tripartite tricarboxylate transporter substrate-binding protein [Oribacterium sp. HCP28S3_H8]|uniref:tripartite tricarboxylate transporter substrate-binding protein n=1 Tax=Oribacterium sp. HCP28S3_H8 TaxID=3438945 RepID=UPI003F8AE982